MAQYATRMQLFGTSPVNTAHVEENRTHEKKFERPSLVDVLSPIPKKFMPSNEYDNLRKRLRNNNYGSLPEINQI